MPTLIDCFSPGEILHMVSVANKHLLLTTDQKRFLIGLRMAEVDASGTYKIGPEKIGKFNRIFGQFLNELKPGQRCDKDSCSTCDRLQTLLDDFHGAQATPEFQRFIEWFQKSTMLYTGEGSDDRIPASAVRAEEPRPAAAPAISRVPVAEPQPARSEAYRPAPAPAPVPDPAPAPRPEPSEPYRPAPAPAPEPAAAAPLPAAAAPQPVVVANLDHPLVRRLVELGMVRLDQLSVVALLEHANQLQDCSRQLLAALGGTPAELPAARG